MSFKALGLHPHLLQATREMRYAEPTPVQAQAIPAVLAGRDLIATAQTGTGKTAAFLLPILHRLLALPRGTTRALVVTPTRELAQQIDDVCLGLAYHTPVRVGLLVGGAAMRPQERALRAGVELLVATPGRLLDHMRQNQARFDRLHTLVLIPREFRPARPLRGGHRPVRGSRPSAWVVCHGHPLHGATPPGGRGGSVSNRGVTAVP